MEISKITSKGQLTLPKEVRDSLHIDNGSLVALFVDKKMDAAVMRRVEVPEEIETLQELHRWGKKHLKGKRKLNLSEVSREIHRIRGE